MEAPAAFKASSAVNALDRPALADGTSPSAKLAELAMIRSEAETENPEETGPDALKEPRWRNYMFELRSWTDNYVITSRCTPTTQSTSLALTPRQSSWLLPSTRPMERSARITLSFSRVWKLELLH